MMKNLTKIAVCLALSGLCLTAHAQNKNDVVIITVDLPVGTPALSVEPEPAAELTAEPAEPAAELTLRTDSEPETVAAGTETAEPAEPAEPKPDEPEPKAE